MRCAPPVRRSWASTPLSDAQLPGVDGLFIGGGFPELFAADLEANTALRTRIRAAIDAGMPVYAECGGLMYLARTLTYKGQTHRMVGAIPGDVVMHERPIGRGYVNLEETRGLSLVAGGGRGATFARTSSTTPASRTCPQICAMPMRSCAAMVSTDAATASIVHNMLASYAAPAKCRRQFVAARFVDFVRHNDYRLRRRDNIVYLSPSRGREAMVL